MQSVERASSRAFASAVILALDSLATRLPAVPPDFDPAWTKEQTEDWLEEELYRVLARRQEDAVEWTLRKILREEGKGDEDEGEPGRT